ncbi:cell envelope integrity protein TolA [Inmirania thermothiophila]|uniref:Colicin import membrane protein n=1 Tax=Inmirania thermothiophila TaxID=1750597 RepID=A0A3N1XT13_9GAMM|nr:cell envelope integrity protein TolA [Inmirania thermothiophila]ROR29796.1 colicin import membrane protein [Inmirania thermothiophila]
MWREIRERPRALLYSLLLHAGLLGLLAASLSFSPRLPQPERVEIVQAVALDEQRVQRELAALERAEAERRKAEEEAARKARLAREQEERRLAELRRRRAAEERRLEALVEQKAKAAQEAKRLAALRREQEAEARRLAELERRKKAEAERLAALERERKIAEAERRKAEEEARRKAEEEARRKAEEEARRRALEEEQRRLAQERARLALQEVARYTDAIRQRVERAWVRPTGLPKGLSAIVRVRLIPGGDVAGVQIARSSGNAAFDKSAEEAVYRAAPLPVPSDPEVFDRMREIQFVFKPEE